MPGRQSTVSAVSDRSGRSSYGHGKDHRCGVGPCHPSCAQPCANMKAYTAALCSILLLDCVYGTYAMGVRRTVEKRFGFSSYEAGLIPSVSDLTHTFLVLVVGYVGRKVHKPRYLSISSIFSTLGFFMCAVPYFIYGPYQYKTEATSGMNKTASSGGILGDMFGDSASTDDIDYQICRLDGSHIANESTCGNADNVREGAENLVAFYMFLCHSVVVGMGYSGLWTLGFTFIDENTKKEDAALYIGIAMTMFALGPVIGFPLAAFCTSLPENLLDSSVSPYDPAFIGCWWLGYVIIGVAMGICLIPMFFLPKHFPEYYISRKALRKQRRGSTTSTSEALVTGIKDIPRNLWKLLSNVPLILLCLSQILWLYLIIGVLNNQPKYIEVHFGQPAFVANLAAALSGAVAGAAGTFLGGIIMKVFKVQEKAAALMYLAGIGITMLGLFALIAMGCTQPPTPYGTGSQLTEVGYNVSLECNVNCRCSRDGDSYQAVCDSQGVEYFSPCHAGCTIPYTNYTSGCACLADPGASLSSEWCERSCPLFIPYVVVSAVIGFLGAMAGVPGMILIFRLVDPKLKTFALGFLSACENLLVWVPGPVMFGVLFDSSCLLWKTSCGERMSCMVYDNAKYRYYMHGLAIGLVGIAFFLSVWLYCLIKRRDDEGESDETPPEKVAMNRVGKEENI